MLVVSTTLSKRKTIATILKIEDLGIVFWGNLLFFFSGISPCCSGVCFNLLRGLFHFPSMAYRHVARHICFYFGSQSFVIHALHRRTAFGSCQLDVSGFRKSLVIHAHRARPDCRVAKDCEANYFQCAE